MQQAAQASQTHGPCTTRLKLLTSIAIACLVLSSAGLGCSNAETKRKTAMQTICSCTMFAGCLALAFSMSVMLVPHGHSGYATRLETVLTSLLGVTRLAPGRHKLGAVRQLRITNGCCALSKSQYPRVTGHASKHQMGVGRNYQPGQTASTLHFSAVCRIRRTFA